MLKWLWKKLNSRIRVSFYFDFDIWLEEKRKGILVSGAFNELMGPGLRDEFMKAYKQDIEELKYLKRK